MKKVSGKMFLAGQKFVRRNGNVAQNIDGYFEENLSG